MLLDVADGAFDLAAQEKLWQLNTKGSALRQLPGVLDCILGVNNLLIFFDPLQVVLPAFQHEILAVWGSAVAQSAIGKQLEVPVHYDTAADSEFARIAEHAGLNLADAIKLHCGGDYIVACVGAVPGFPYLVGMSPKLSAPRRATPRPDMPKGAVAIGGAQTGIIPMCMPSGWHQIGHTELSLFDPSKAQPCLLSPGDRVRFLPC
ncbi:MAG: hypothetical protein RLZZ502_1563 [Pseudomonadota bacterium]|jgi:KipI family sensor histidine kinase inhibitor